jgi:hypothetical protein
VDGAVTGNLGGVGLNSDVALVWSAQEPQCRNRSLFTSKGQGDNVAEYAEALRYRQLVYSAGFESIRASSKLCIGGDRILSRIDAAEIRRAPAFIISHMQLLHVTCFELVKSFLGRSGKERWVGHKAAVLASSGNQPKGGIVKVSMEARIFQAHARVCSTQ